MLPGTICSALPGTTAFQLARVCLLLVMFAWEMFLCIEFYSSMNEGMCVYTHVIHDFLCICISYLIGIYEN